MISLKLKLMTKKEILKAAEENAMNYCMHRSVAKVAFVEGALWALNFAKELLMDTFNTDKDEA